MAGATQEGVHGEGEQQSSSSEAQAIEPLEASKGPGWLAATALSDDAGGIVLRSLDDLFRYSRMVIAAGMAPSGLKRPEQVAILVQCALEAGLPITFALKWGMVVNGRPCWWGDAPLILARRHKLWVEAAFEEHWENEPEKMPAKSVDLPDNYAAVCTAQRRGGPPKTYRFSVAQARKAGLLGKSGPWQEYPDRMLKFRARGFNFRDLFGEAFSGMGIAEELYGLEEPANLVGDAEAVPKNLDGLAAALRQPATKVEQVKAEPAPAPVRAAREEPPAPIELEDEPPMREPGDDGEDLG